MVRWVSKYVDPVMATGWHMILGGLPLLALAAQREGGQLLPRLADLTGEPLHLPRCEQRWVLSVKLEPSMYHPILA